MLFAPGKVQVGFDTETYLIRDGLLVPRLVCASISTREPLPCLAALDDGEALRVNDTTVLLDRRAAALAFATMVLEPSVNLVIHNAAFDVAVMHRAILEELGISLFDSSPTAFDLYDPEVECATVYCTKTREKLIAIAEDRLDYDPRTRMKNPRFDLATLVRNYYGVDLAASKKGPDVWRLRYAELDGVPLSNWPKAAVEYAADDALWHLKVGVAQAHAKESGGGHVLVDEQGHVTDEYPQAASAFALHLCAVHGVRTDHEASNAFRGEAERGVAEGIAVGLEAGFLRENKRSKTGYSENRAALVERIEAAYAARGEEAPRTDKGRTQYGADVLAASGDKLLERYAESASARKVISSFADPLLRGFEHPLTSMPVTLVATGRTAWAKPPLQQPPRKGGYRECFIPRPGYLFGTADWSVAELCALAQVQVDWYGSSALADAINAGVDVHLWMGAHLLGCSYEEAKARFDAGDPEAEAARQAAKAGNFGYPGGLGAATFVTWCRGQGFELSRDGTEADAHDHAKEIKAAWLAAWPESGRYLRDIGWRCDATGTFEAVQPASGRIRGGCKYTSGANTHFQGYVADFAKAALWRTSIECYTGRRYDDGGPSPLHGSRPWLFIHDEILLEAPEDTASEAVLRMAEIMITTAEQYHPDVKARADAALMRRWYKSAKPVFDDEGRLIPWEPSK
jgi:DNA polymerase-1